MIKNYGKIELISTKDTIRNDFLRRKMGEILGEFLESWSNLEIGSRYHEKRRRGFQEPGDMTVGSPNRRLIGSNSSPFGEAVNPSPSLPRSLHRSVSKLSLARQRANEVINGRIEIIRWIAESEMVSTVWYDGIRKRRSRCCSNWATSVYDFFIFLFFMTLLRSWIMISPIKIIE